MEGENEDVNFYEVGVALSRIIAAAVASSGVSA